MIQISRQPPFPGVHVILGDSAGGIFTRNYGRQYLLVDPDVLSVGPTPACESFEAWKAIRDEFWRNLMPGSFLNQFPGTDLSDHRERMRDAERINIWAATGLTEQLFIAHALHLIDSVGIGTERVHLLQFENLRGRQAQILGMGELNEANMADHPEPTLLVGDTAEDYRAAWNALTASDPTAIEKYEATRPGANRWLKRAMRLMLRRLPNRHSGLPHWDHVLLAEVCKHGPRAVRIVGHAMVAEWDDADLTGDWFLFGRLLKLGDENLPKPLLTLSGDLADMRKTEVAITPFGLDVLEGRLSAFPTNPIDDWAAGTRLSSATGNLWFNDDGRVVKGVQ